MWVVIIDALHPVVQLVHVRFSPARSAATFPGIRIAGTPEIERGGLVSSPCLSR
jgi:hypothetical protein